MISWLFFGLISAVVFDDDTSNNRQFDWELLLSEDRAKIDTKELTGILETWRVFETDKKNECGRNMRLIRAQLALDVARKVIQNHSPNPDVKNRAQTEMQLDPDLSLALMVLGETLTNAKDQIIRQVGFEARDWHGDTNTGWGSPTAVLEKMDRGGWCPRTKKLLRTQLRESATALLSVFASHRSHTFEGHGDCKEDEPCKLKSVNIRGEYATKHHVSCLHRNLTCDFGAPADSGASGRPGKCEGVLTTTELDHELPTCYTPCVNMIGVPIAEVIKILDEGKVPLIRFKRRASKKKPVELEVVESSSCPEYATISHVWSDGYGNPVENKLWRCQLDYFWDLLREAQLQKNRQKTGELRKNPEPLAFWMDTLVVPVQKEYKEQRKKAIAQIHRVYSKARYTIVIDNGLNSMPWDDRDYTTTAMRILASGWMRRLWTLQEAYLSRKLLFAFERWKQDSSSIPLVDLDEIEELYAETDEKLISSLPANARSYYHNMLGQDRKARIHSLTSTNGVGLVASVWKAAQWRVCVNLFFPDTISLNLM